MERLGYRYRGQQLEHELEKDMKKGSVRFKDARIQSNPRESRILQRQDGDSKPPLGHSHKLVNSNMREKE
jgi:hypothetical protein